MSIEDVSIKVVRIMAIIDREGMPPLPPREWIEMLREIREECTSRIESAGGDPNG